VLLGINRDLTHLDKATLFSKLTPECTSRSQTKEERGKGSGWRRTLCCSGERAQNVLLTFESRCGCFPTWQLFLCRLASTDRALCGNTKDDYAPPPPPICLPNFKATLLLRFSPSGFQTNAQVLGAQDGSKVRSIFLTKRSFFQP
jgi:hypothetical protein